jgi:O-acetylhomoserine (thiol)-lyase
MVSSAFLFGNTNSLFNTFQQFGVEVTFVDATDAEQVSAAIRTNTRLVFVETIANPRTQIADLKRIGELCRSRQLLYCVDNTMTSPYLFQPAVVQAHLVFNALTKYIGGHGNALGGAVTDTGIFDWAAFQNIHDTYKSGDSRLWGITQIKKKGLRDFGATLGPEAAHHIAVGSETLALRMDRACANAMQLAKFCASHPQVKKVYYPGLPSHPQHERAAGLFRHFGALFSLDLQDDLDCFDFLNRLDCVISSSNLGDVRTLAIPVAHTIYHEMGPQRRASMGIEDSMIRVSVGIEDIEDLLSDFGQALS